MLHPSVTDVCHGSQGCLSEDPPRVTSMSNSLGLHCRLLYSCLWLVQGAVLEGR